MIQNVAKVILIIAGAGLLSAAVYAAARILGTVVKWLSRRAKNENCGARMISGEEEEA